MLSQNRLPDFQKFNRIREALRINTSPTMTLLEKLRIYDEAVGLEKVSRVDPNVLSIFQSLLEMHEDHSLIQPAHHNFSSPPSHRMDQIQDPELFSFSKVREQEKSGPSSTAMGHTRRGLKFAKNKTDKPKHSSYPQQNQDVSEFMEEQECDRLASPVPIHILSKKIQQQRVRAWFNQFVTSGRKIIELRRLKLQSKSSKYVHELNLLRKSVRGLIQYKNWIKQALRNRQNQRNTNIKSSYFNFWKEFANRDQQQRQRQQQIKDKKMLLMRTLGLRKLISNCYVFESNQKQTFSRFSKEIKSNHKYKVNHLLKSRYLIHFRQLVQKKKVMADSSNLLVHALQKSQFSVLLKLSKCLFEREQIQEIQKIERLQIIINGRLLLNNLRQELHFQKVYWQPSGGQKYQKIVLIADLIEAVQHRLARQGFGFYEDEQSLLNEAKKHPAYAQFFLPYKLKKAFWAFRSYFATIKRKQDQIKYCIMGGRVCNQMRSALAINRTNQHKKQNLGQKIFTLVSCLQGKQINSFFTSFGKRTNLKQQYLMTSLDSKSKLRALRILKSYKISKRFYLRRFSEKTSLRARRILECCFLEWKLFQKYETHRRLLQAECWMMRQRTALSRLTQIVDENGLVDRIHRRKVQNLRINRRRNYGEVLLDRLIDYSSRGQQRQIQNMALSSLKKISFNRVLGRMRAAVRAKKISKEVSEGVTHQYELRQKYKILQALKACSEYRKVEKERACLIRRNCKQRKQRTIFESLTEKMLQKITLKRMVTILRVNSLSLGLSKLSQVLL